MGTISLSSSEALVDSVLHLVLKEDERITSSVIWVKLIQIFVVKISLVN